MIGAGWHVARSSESSKGRDNEGTSWSSSTQVVAWHNACGAQTPSAEGWGYRTAQEAEGGGRRLRGAGIAAQRRA